MNKKEKAVREEVKSFLGSGKFRECLRKSNPQKLSKGAITYILDSVVLTVIGL